MGKSWIPLPSTPPLLSSVAPLLFEREGAAEVRDEFITLGARVADIDLSTVTTRPDLFDQLRSVLVFPEWCGSGWDSIDDGFEEIRAASSFPCVVFVHGLQDLLRRDVHIGLEIVIRMSELQGAFSVAGDQFIPAYEVE